MTTTMAERTMATKGMSFALALAGAVLMAPLAQAAPEGWSCEAGTCTAEAETPITRLTGVFEYGANLSRTTQVDRLAELEQQRWREFRFIVLAPARINARATLDRSYVPADWPSDISLANVGVDVSRHYSLDGKTYTRIDDGFVLPVGALLSVIVGQDTWGGGSSYATFYPASWSLDISARRVVDEADLAAVDLAQLPLLADDAVAPLGQADTSSSDLDAAIDATMPCEGAECRPPGDDMLADAPGQGDLVDPAAGDTGDVATSDDPTLQVDPPVGDCGQGMLECKPEPEPEDVAAESTGAPAGLAADPLAVELQTELARVGCYEGAIDGLWGPASRRALNNFNRWADKDAQVDNPTPKALVTVARTAAPVCGVD